ncbi:MAG: flagellar hook-associated protein FlgK [Polyangia bacterium]
MDLNAIMQNAATSMNVYRAQIATASNNIANADTPGYAREEAVATEAEPVSEAGSNSYIGSGVTLQAVIEERDPNVEAQLPTAFSNSSSSSAESNALSDVTALDPQATGGVANALGSFYAALTNLSQNPGDSELRQAAVDSAQSLATAFNTTANSISSAQSGIDQNVTSLVSQVNGLVSDVANLNGGIALAVNSGRTPNDLIDQRQNDLDQLAQMIGAQPVTSDHGTVNVVLPNGTCLVSGTVASQLTAQADPANGGHVDVVFQSPDGSTPAALDQSDVGGQIGGLLSARDNGLGTALSSLNNLALNLTSVINQQSEQGYALDGTTGHNLFAALTSSTNAAANMAVDSSVSADPSLLAAAGSVSLSSTGVATVASGDATNLQAMIATQNTTLPASNLDATQTFANLTSAFGLAASTASDNATFDQNILTSLTNARASTSGVSTDDEQVNIMQAENAYDALTKVITTSQTMLQDLMDIISPAAG